MTITWLGHACFLLESEGCRVILDPCKGVPGVPDTRCEADAVYCSHTHFDHSYTDQITIRPERPSPFTVREEASYHDDASGTKRGENTIRVLTAESVSVVHLGDLGHSLSTEQLTQIAKCDVLLLPIGGTYTLDTAQAKQVADAIGARVVIPMHYRKGAMGFDVLQTVDEFTDQYDDALVHHSDTNTITITDPIPAHGGVVVLRLPE